MSLVRPVMMAADDACVGGPSIDAACECSVLIGTGSAHRTLAAAFGARYIRV